jgi:hypothetical protein
MNPLIAAYKNTRYHVFNTGITICIDENNVLLDELLRKQDAKSWAYITAYNPFSQTFTDEANDARHRLLLQSVAAFSSFEGEGKGADESWPPEKSLLILGISKEQAIAIGNEYEQNAIVYGEFGKAAQLLLLRTI